PHERRRGAGARRAAGVEAAVLGPRRAGDPRGAAAPRGRPRPGGGGGGAVPVVGRKVERPGRPGLLERTYLPSILKGMWITFRHLIRPKVTMRYPEETWKLPDNYRGLPALVKDDEERVKCVACFLCEYVCPPKAIHIEAQEIATGVEKGPRV